MKKSFQILVVILSASLMLAACGKKKSDGVAVRAAGNVRSSGDNINGGNSLPSGQPYNPGPGIAVVTDDQYYNQFQQAVKVLVSATMDPNMVGNVSNRDGVILAGEVKVLQNGQLDTQNSKIQLTITDDKRDENGNLYEPIVIKVLGTSGTIRNGQVNMTFADSYGSITLVGNYNNSTFSGELNFQNAKSYNGLSAGTLGRFSVPLCSFFNCQ